MPTIPTPGLDAKGAPSTLGGQGWRPRDAEHAVEIGTVWAPYGVGHAVAPLRDVLLSLPGEEMDYPEEPAAWLMTERPQRDRLLAQTYALAAAYQAEGVTPHLYRPSGPPRPNHIFQADLFFMTPEGAILARPASQQRAGEERAVAAELARLGVPILLTPRGSAVFEGADAMWIEPGTVLVGIGRRTNREAVAQIAPILHGMGVRVRTAELSGGVQHLLGAVLPVDERRVVVLSDHLTPSLREALDGKVLVPFASDEEVVARRSLNFVTLRPGRVMMPAGCPKTREALEGHGIVCVEADVSEYVKAAGGIGCLTGVLRRG